MHHFHALLIATSSIIAILAVMPYQLEIIRGKAKPRVATWLVWSALSGLAGTSALLDHQLAAGLFTLSTCAQDMLIVVLGFKIGDRRFAPLDIASLLAGAVGVGALIVLKSPAVATVIAMATDMVGTVPTVGHCWRRPFEETLRTYVMFVVAEWIILMIADYKVFTSYAYPLFLLLEDGLLATIVLFSPHRIDALAPTEVTNAERS